MSFDSKGEFPEQDRLMLELNSKSNWVPPNPAELVRPFMEKDPLGTDTPLDKRRQKAYEVVAGYGKIIEECQALRASLEKKCKNVVIPIDQQKDIRVMEAASRLFRRKVTEITFGMYKEAIEKLAKISNDGAPGIGG
jgi:hypothetical protein